MKRQLPFGGFRRAQDTGAREDIGAQVDAVLSLKFQDDVLEEELVEIVAAELGIAVA